MQKSAGKAILGLVLAVLLLLGLFLVVLRIPRGGEAAPAVTPLPSAPAAATPEPTPSPTPVPTPEPTPSPTPEPTPRPILPQYAAYYEEHPDLVGWLTIEGTPIDYPVMYTPWDQNYYLHLDPSRHDSEAGTLFIGVPWTPENRNTVVYGHHMADGSMFAGLMNFASESFGTAPRTIRFDTIWEEAEYELVAAFRSRVYYDEDPPEGAFLYYEYHDLPDEEAFAYYVSELKKAALYDTGVTPAYGDQLLTLSTCAYHVQDGRFVVVARKIVPES